MPLSVQAAEIAKRMIAASTGAATLMAFLRSTYEAAADLAGWDRPALECEIGVPRRPRDVKV